MAVISVRDISKSFGDVTALDGLSFDVEEGEIFGFLGPNGAGKTTSISIIAGLLLPDAGSVTIAGHDVRRDGRRARRLLGVVPQEIALYEELTGRENLHFWGGLQGLSGAALREATGRVLESVGLVERADDQVRTYSGGMKRRINLGAGLIHRPRILLLDEPTQGIDPQARIRLLDVVRAEAAAGTTVIYTTHYLEEAEALCDRIAIIDGGKILASGPLSELVLLAGEESIVTVEGDFGPGDVDSLLEGVAAQGFERGSVRFAASDRGVIGAVLGRFFSAGVAVGDISIREPSLESVFIKLTGRALRD